MSARLKALREWWSGPLAKVGVVLAVLAFIPKWYGVLRFWRGVALWAWERISWLSTGWGRVSLLVCGLLLIWYDHHRRTKKRPHDLKTLKGRTLKLRDGIEIFRNALGEEAQIEKLPAETVEDYMVRVGRVVVPRVLKVSHGYALHFASDVELIHHEFGERGNPNFRLAALIERPQQTEETLGEIITELSTLADLPEALT